MLPRRDFLNIGAAVSLAAVGAKRLDAIQAGDSQRTVRIGVMGLSRGAALATGFAKLPGVEVTMLCDVDQRRAESLKKQMAELSSVPTKVVTDFRRILDDPKIDALVCAAPNHWHGPATILGCKAGKHVYVEKPCSHNPQEGEWMIAAAEKYNRCVQMGTQWSSSPRTIEAMGKLHGGAIGQVHLARCYYTSARGSIGRGVKKDPPPELDYELWQGPAPRRPYQDNVVHYNWHWFWHWGGGELANNGVHTLNLARWGLQVEFPRRVVSSGGRYWFDDDQETPDTQSVGLEFKGNKQITWNSMSCNKHSQETIVAFYGDGGSMELETGGAHRIFDRNDKLVDEVKRGSDGMEEHFSNFVEAIRANNPKLLRQPIAEGHRSTLLCHLGNIAQRTGQTVRCDESNGHILENAEQQALWQREYEPSWRSDVTTV